MSHRHLVVGCLAVLLAAAAVLWAAEPRNEGWQAVEDAIEQGLPKTAIEKLEPLIAAARAEGRYAEAIKAVALKISLQGTIQGNRAEVKITALQAEIDEAPAPMQPMMQAILANWYWHYFQQNRWRFVQRTETAEPPSDDFTTWSLPRILAEIDRQFTATLSHAELLQNTPVTEYDALLEAGTAPDSYRPTLFDFVAHEALQFYTAGEQAGSRRSDAFDLLADSPIFAPAAEFLNWQPAGSDSDAPTRKAIALYQQLLRFHQARQQRDAFLDVDLQRLQFGYNLAVGEEKAERYQAALRRFAAQHADHVISARARHALATVVYEQGDWAAARRIAAEGLQQHPDSVGGRRCFNLIQTIEAPESELTTERVWNQPRPSIDVHYRNLTKVYLRLVPWSFTEFLESDRWQAEQLDPSQREALLARRPVREWSADLPPTEDFQTRTETLTAPADLAPGPYFLIASHDAEFADRDNQVSFTEVWESDLALVIRSHQGRGLIDGFVLDAASGQPIAGAVVQAWDDSPRQRLRELAEQTTDAQGRFEFRGDQLHHLRILASHGKHSLASSHYLHARQYPRADRFERTLFFTDRALYRPGQTIRYKGICVSVDQAEDDYRTIPGAKLTVVLTDVNGTEVARQPHRTNDYGSFSGSFTAPRDRLLGEMSMRVESGPSGATEVTVEEYKRPKFRVQLDAPQQGVQLGEPVAMQGTATAYTGAAINDALVSYRVVREVRYPIWWFWRNWWLPPPSGDSQEIAHGSTTTDAAGRFAVEFTARPDLSVDRASEPIFRFTLYADVTDATGETRSDQRTIQVGYTALSATLSADEYLTDERPVEIKLRTETLDGEGQAATGTVTVMAVKQPDEVRRDRLSPIHQPWRGDRHGDRETPPVDPANPLAWPLGEQVYETEFTTDPSGTTTLQTELAAGMYRAQLETTDRFGNRVTAELPLTVIDPDAPKLNLKIPNLVVIPEPTVQPGAMFQAIWGSGYDQARAYLEIEHRGELLQSFWTEPGQTQVLLTQPVDEAMRGGFTFRATMVRENRVYTESRHIEVPWTNKQLELRWEHFVSKLEPAARETWTAVVTGPDAETRVAELVAAMYDASLDAYLPHHWPAGFGLFRTDHSIISIQFENRLKHLQHLVGHWHLESRDGSLTYREFHPRIIQNLWGYQFRTQAMQRSAGGAPAAMLDAGQVAESVAVASDVAAVKAAPPEAGEGESESPASPALDHVSPRRNLQETAFFFPHLVSAEDGSVRIEFTMPEALTTWKFLGFAHDNQLRGGLLSDTTVTAKDLMVQPNPPRFLRAGDVLEFTVKITNQSPTQQTGTARLSFADARTGAAIDDQLDHRQLEQPFAIPAGQSHTLAWRIAVPDALAPISYTAVASTGRLSDGETGLIPVLSRRVLVTESLALPMRGAGTKEFAFAKLLAAGDSDSLQHQSLTVQMVSNPSWYAVLALPYLMEYPFQCTEQTFNRLYANALAQFIANSDPQIERVFEQWRGTDALDSPLEKNQDLKSVMLEETPWLRDAIRESQARRNVGILFDDNRLEDELGRALQQLTAAQYDDGAWPWFPGGPANDYITLYITTGFGRLRHLGVNIDATAAIESLQRLDDWMTRRYTEIKPADRAANQLSATIALYLYGRSFFRADREILPQHQQAFQYWLSQAQQYWLDLPHRQSQAHLAVALHRFGHAAAAQAIMQSIKERSVSDEELGMFWRDQELSWWWYRAPIETQAMMIEAFDEVMNDQPAVEDCQVWLLKQKQTRDWKTTKATADAVYALLLRGTDRLASNALVEVALAGQTVAPQAVEAGTGFFQQRFVGGEVRPELGAITVRKDTAGVAWGSVHWQYLEDLDKVTPAVATPLTLTKTLYVKRNTETGKQLDEVAGPVAVGEELVVRLVLRTDRDLEYVHLKDYRGSGTEPVNVLSQYQYQDGLAYYQSTRDAASHFFIDYLPKGTYVFEYSTRVQLRGRYETGFAHIECMYAPEFSSHSESFSLVVE